jgi:hypothetical protein
MMAVPLSSARKYLKTPSFCRGKLAFGHFPCQRGAASGVCRVDHAFCGISATLAGGVLTLRSRAGLVALSAGLWLAAVAPQAAAEDPAAPGAGSSRRATFVGTVGALALLVGGVGVYLSLRHRRARPEPPPAAEPGPLVRISAPTPRAMACPTCRKEYEVEARFCKRDGNRLVPIAELTDPRAPAGSVCPICDHGYDPGVSVCPTDGEELVPWALRERMSDPGSERTLVKICPTCGSHYPGGSGFCGSDGTALVMVN